MVEFQYLKKGAGLETSQNILGSQKASSDSEVHKKLKLKIKPRFVSRAAEPRRELETMTVGHFWSENEGKRVQQHVATSHSSGPRLGLEGPGLELGLQQHQIPTTRS